MAARSWTPGPQALEVGTVLIYTGFTVGASGAVSAPVGVGKGITSIVRNSAGRYTITLQDQYLGLLQATVTSVDSTGAAVQGQVASASVSSATPTVVVQFYSSAPAAADPNTTAQVKIALTLKNSTV